MQCSCPECDTLMAKVERGFESECKCAECGYRCDICLGTDSVIAKGQIKSAPQFQEAPEKRG